MAKVEWADHPHQQLQQEHRIYTILKWKPGIGSVVEGIGTHLSKNVVLKTADGNNDRFNLLFLDQLGIDLSTIQKRMRDLYTTKANPYYCMNKHTVINCATQMFMVVQTLHDGYFIHRDIKLSNFMMGGGIEKHMLYLIDFGLSKQYKNSYGEHMNTDQKYQVNIGTKSYSSRFVLENQTPTRRDDLISVIYAILALILGALPWDLHYNAYIKNPEAQESLRKFSGQKREDAKKKLYDGIAMKLKKWEARHLFFEFEIYDEYREICAIYEHFLSLKPQEDPNYDIIDGALEQIQMRHSYKWDYFEWLHKGNPSPENPKNCVYDDLEKEFKHNYGKDPSRK
ncbi:unnamed protein product [Oikopleura dioica]|uniref:non-specific serine/threonine protein kinase n=1 Tax=Oikopleura dioica TaxID=34765 RepID=E4YYA9_OIKDI|nr:unnamed protein product [Oikopleura dioica]